MPIIRTRKNQFFLEDFEEVYGEEMLPYVSVIQEEQDNRSADSKEVKKLLSEKQQTLLPPTNLLSRFFLKRKIQNLK